jgi:hypothetical protein
VSCVELHARHAAAVVCGAGEPEAEPDGRWDGAEERPTPSETRYFLYTSKIKPVEWMGEFMGELNHDAVSIVGTIAAKISRALSHRLDQ